MNDVIKKFIRNSHVNESFFYNIDPIDIHVRHYFILISLRAISRCV